MSRSISGGEAYSPEVWSMVPGLFRGEAGVVNPIGSRIAGFLLMIAFIKAMVLMMRLSQRNWQEA